MPSTLLNIADLIGDYKQVLQPIDIFYPILGGREERRHFIDVYPLPSHDDGWHTDR